ncbi:hypothetical protein LLEC1_00213 [Akanthomyces lecanii]|uniref:Non-structural maintenance of chromosomes element 4 n=1 Tax=Cordyceps confragosa TaxID=2714763 RepID=A0A179IJG4_CORDF|nr:hypothetical protein LLEC1_00213 [Akanthomyces lecanii]
MEEDFPGQRENSDAPPSAQRDAGRSVRHSTPSTKRKRTDGGAARLGTTPESTDSYDEDVYDPDQPLAERRKVQKSFRELLREVTENSEEYLQSGSHGLYDTIIKANELTKQVRQTTEATIDSRLLVSTTDLSYRKTLRLTQGSLSHGVDVDELVSKCITFMRQERGTSGEGEEDGEEDNTPRQQRRRRGDPPNGIDDSEDRDGDMMNWGHLGKFACLPHSRRPALSGLLLGPLSVERKIRRVSKRSAPFRPNNLAETRPEILSIDDLAKKENDLTAICGKIFQQLQNIQEQVQEAVAEAIENEMSDEEKIDIMHQHGLRRTGGIDLMRFVVNPNSFGQTVENIFYVSFLIRDGRIEIEYDEYDLPALGNLDDASIPSTAANTEKTAPVVREDHENEPSRQGSAKYQAVLSIDMQTWEDIVETLHIKEPMIEHRSEIVNSGPGARGWYS